MKHESFQSTANECPLRMLILINGLRSVRTDRCGPIDRSPEDPRQGFDDFGELLTTCAAVNHLLVVEGAELPKERNSRKVSRSNRCAPDRFKKGGEGESMAMCMHAVKVGTWRTLCLLPLRGSRPDSQRQDS